jgi:hypothetical protein
MSALFPKYVEKLETKNTPVVLGLKMKSPPSEECLLIYEMPFSQVSSLVKRTVSLI